MKLFRTPRLFRFVFPGKTWGFSSPDSVYLTFDDGPDPELTPWILDFLKRENIKATFFLVGENVQRYPELYQRILKDGHRVGNHTMKHLKGTKNSYKSYIRSVDQADKLIQSDLFRPPYGRITSVQALKLKKYYKLIMWSWLSYDYDHTVPVPEVLSNANSIRPGDIIVLHDNKKSKDRLKVILPELVKILRRKNYKMKTIA